MYERCDLENYKNCNTGISVSILGIPAQRKFVEFQQCATPTLTPTNEKIVNMNADLGNYQR